MGHSRSPLCPWIVEAKVDRLRSPVWTAAVFLVGVVATLGFQFMFSSTDGAASIPAEAYQPLLVSSPRVNKDALSLAPSNVASHCFGAAAMQGPVYRRTPNPDPKGVCGPGVGGSKCDLSRRIIFAEHDPFEGVAILEKDLQGWSPSASIYEHVAAVTSATVIIEIGVWKGLSAAYLARSLRERGAGVLFAVDTWLGAIEFWLLGDREHDLKWVNGHPRVYDIFMSNMVHENISDYVVPFPAPSRLAAAFFTVKGVQADVIHIDAAHEYNDVREDIDSWWPLVRPCGVLMGDDFNSFWPDVMKAAAEFAEAQTLPLQVSKEENSGKWIVQKGTACPQRVNVTVWTPGG